MDLKFMWYANATVVNNIMPRHKRFDDEYDITVLQKTIRDKYMKYDVTIGGERYHFNYTFFSNVCIAGSLEILDLNSGKTYTYAIERNNDSIRLYVDLENYNEMYLYNNSTIIDIQVNSCRKSYISCLTITQLDEKDYNVTLIRTAVTDAQRSNFDFCLNNQLFTVTGAIDYPKMVCYDVVNFVDRSTQMVIYAETKCQMIVSHSFETDHVAGKVHPINSDFNEYIKYKKLDEYHYQVTEFILNNSEHPFVKRSYELINEEPNLIAIRGTNKRFRVTTNNNDVTITLI